MSRSRAQTQTGGSLLPSPSHFIFPPPRQSPIPNHCPAAGFSGSHIVTSATAGDMCPLESEASSSSISGYPQVLLARRNCTWAAWTSSWVSLCTQKRSSLSRLVHLRVSHSEEMETHTCGYLPWADYASVTMYTLEYRPSDDVIPSCAGQVSPSCTKNIPMLHTSSLVPAASKCTEHHHVVGRLQGPDHASYRPLWCIFHYTQKGNFTFRYLRKSDLLDPVRSLSMSFDRWMSSSSSHEDPILQSLAHPRHRPPSYHRIDDSPACTASSDKWWWYDIQQRYLRVGSRPNTIQSQDHMDIQITAKSTSPDFLSKFGSLLGELHFHTGQIHFSRRSNIGPPLFGC